MSFIYIIMNVSRVCFGGNLILYLCVRNLTICHAHMMLEELNATTTVPSCNVVNAYNLRVRTCNDREKIPFERQVYAYAAGGGDKNIIFLSNIQTYYIIWKNICAYMIFLCELRCAASCNKWMENEIYTFYFSSSIFL